MQQYTMLLPFCEAYFRVSTLFPAAVRGFCLSQGFVFWVKCMLKIDTPLLSQTSISHLITILTVRNCCQVYQKLKLAEAVTNIFWLMLGNKAKAKQPNGDLNSLRL